MCNVTLPSPLCVCLQEEKWRPYILESESALTRLKEELSDLGLHVEVAIGGRTTLNISPHSLHFARMAHTLSRDLAPLTRWA